ncbi:MAG TPA: GNAT family N-acetyltransferase [Bacillota bacterium]|nr:GNAT family N-acetyltransferase [Bacillota bacterium]
MIALRIGVNQIFTPNGDIGRFVRGTCGHIVDRNDDGSETTVGIIAGLWFQIDDWIIVGKPCDYRDMFSQFSPEVSLAGDLLVPEPPEIRRDVTDSDRHDIILLECVFVEKPYRNCGIGTAALEGFLRYARSRAGVVAIEPFPMEKGDDGVIRAALKSSVPVEHKPAGPGSECELLPISDGGNCSTLWPRFLRRLGFEPIPEECCHHFAVDPSACSPLARQRAADGNPCPGLMTVDDIAVEVVYSPVQLPVPYEGMKAVVTIDAPDVAW